MAGQFHVMEFSFEGVTELDTENETLNIEPIPEMLLSGAIEAYNSSVYVKQKYPMLAMYQMQQSLRSMLRAVLRIYECSLTSIDDLSVSELVGLITTQCPITPPVFLVSVSDDVSDWKDGCRYDDGPALDLDKSFSVYARLVVKVPQWIDNLISKGPFE